MEAAANPRIGNQLPLESTDRTRVVPVPASQWLVSGLTIPVSNEQLLRVLVACLPLITATLAAKTIMMFDVMFPLGANTIDFYVQKISSLPGEVISASALAAAMAVLAVTYTRQRIGWRNTALTAAILLIVIDLVLLLFRITPGLYSGNAAAWAGQHALFLFNMFRWDLVFLLGFLTLCLLLIIRWPNARATRFSAVAILVVQVPLVLIIALATACYVKTGEHGSSELLLFALSQHSGLWPILKSEFDVVCFLILATPFAILAFSSWNLFKNFDLQDSGTLEINPGYVLWPALAVLILAPNMNYNANHFQLEQNLILTIGKDLIRPQLSSNNRTPIQQHAQANPPLFDTRGMTLVPTEHVTDANVILVILESAGADAISIDDGSMVNTPFLHQFAAESTIVEEMYAVVPRTLASWISVLQGVYPSSSNVTMDWGARVEESSDTYASLPNLLRTIGYKSAFFTPTHLDFENERQLISNIGFDDVVARDDYETGDYEIVNYFGWEDRIMTRPVLNWVDRQVETNSPFILTLMTNVGHHDYKPPRAWPKRQYAGALNGQHNDYLNSLAYIDAFLADLFSEFEQRNLLKESIIVIVGDHGESFGAHGRRQHMSVLYEETLRVPAIIRSPAQPPDRRRISGVWQLTDIFPTIVQELGYAFSEGHVPGQSVFDDISDVRPAYFASGLDNSYLGVRHGDLKFIYYYDRRPTEVYNVVIDPLENENIRESLDDHTVQTIEQNLLAWHYAVKFGLTNDSSVAQPPVLVRGYDKMKRRHGDY